MAGGDTLSREGHRATPRAETRRPVASVLVAVAAVLTLYAVYVGWRSFWFLTDDAFIAFRYVSNSILGHGWVWNPAPFQPVEGYTSFLWVVLLDGVWRTTGVEPPDAANWLSLGFGYATLYLGYRFAMRMTLPSAMERIRWPLWTLVLIGTVSNRTFLTWLSSGLETSLFIFALSCWIYFALADAQPDVDAPAGENLQRDSASGSAGWGRRSMLGLTASALAVALTRPDGLLVFAATLPLVALRLRRAKATGGAGWTGVVWAVPLLGVPLHLLWRFSTYGMWLPNTYYAKVTGPWPTSGLRYLACFILEYGLWLWFALAVAALVASLRRNAGSGRAGAALWPRLLSRAEIWIVTATLLAHVAYYTLIVGGDHFEYRVFSYLILWFFMSAAWFAARVTARPAVSLSLVVLFVLASWPIPWVHWSQTRDLVTRAETRALISPIAAEFPFGVRSVVAQWDEWQAWLIRRSVGRRHQEHKIAYQAGALFWPTREEGSRILWQERAVLAIGGVGVAAWALPNVAIIDEFGLNDRVIAKHITPRPTRNARPRARIMAHERRPPKGYVGCFAPNVLQPYLAVRSCRDELLGRPLQEGSVWQGATRGPVSVHRLDAPAEDEDFGKCDRVLVAKRAVPLADARIRRCESRAWY